MNLDKKTIIASILVVVVLIAGIAFKACSAQKEDDSAGSETVSQMGDGEKKSSKEVKHKYEFIHFYDVAANAEDEIAYDRFEYEMDEFVKKAGLGEIALDESETIDAGDAGKVLEVDVLTSSGDVEDSFSFKFNDGKETTYTCVYSKPDDRYSFAAEAEVSSENDGVAEEAEDPYSTIEVIFSDSVNQTIEDRKINRDELIKECKKCVNECGLLGNVTEVHVNKADDVEKGRGTDGTCFTGRFNDPDMTEFTVDCYGDYFDSAANTD